jgi:putative DNA primase/helicase
MLHVSTTSGVVPSPFLAKQAFQTAVLYLSKIPGASNKAMVLPLQNGHLTILNGKAALTPSDRSAGLRHLIKCDYNAQAPTPTMFNAFLNQILPDIEVQRRVQEYIGYTLIPDACFQIAMWWIGRGMNGKGVLANIVQALHGKFAAVQLDNLSGFALSGMIGASLIYCDEAPKRAINEQSMKSLIAGESVQVDRKYKDPLTVKITGKWLILANHMPAVTDQSHGFWRRMEIVPFGVTIPESERIPNLDEKIINNELPGVLNWALEGLIRLLDRGHFSLSVPPAMAKAKLKVQLETDSVAAWMDDAEIVFEGIPKIPKDYAYSTYSEWCRSHGMCSLGAQRFWSHLGTHVPGLKLVRKVSSSGAKVRYCNLVE